MTNQTPVQEIKPDLDIAKHFIAAMTGDPDTKIRVRVLHDTDAFHPIKNPNGYPSAEVSDTITALWPDIEQSQARGYGVFLIPNCIGFEGDGFANGKDVTGFNSLFADHDKGLPSEFHREPDVTVHSSKGRGHTYWRIQLLPASDADAWRTAQEQLIEYYPGADTAIKNPSRIMRLPGTLHLKDKANAQLVTFTTREGFSSFDEPPTLAKIIEGLPPVATTAKVTEAGETRPDLPGNIATAHTRLANLLKAGTVAIEGKGGNDLTYRVFCELRRDLGLSQAVAIELLLASDWNQACIPPWSREEFTTTLAANVAKYGQNAPGAYATAPPSETFKDATLAPSLEAQAAASSLEIPERITQQSDEYLAKVRKWKDRLRGTTPIEDAELPDPIFYDDDRLLQRDPEGYVCLIQGKKGSMKTFIALAMLIYLAVTKKLHVYYFAGEGGYGVRTTRVQAIARGLGFSLEELSKYWATSNTVPNLFDEHARAATIELLRETPSDIIVIDTLGQASPGQDLNSPAYGTLLTSCTAELRHIFGCCIVLIHHLGKDATKGALGSTMIIADPGTIIEVRAVKDHADLRELYVHHVREDEGNRSIGFRITHGVSDHGKRTPVPQRIAPFELVSAKGKADRPTIDPVEGKFAALGVEVRTVARMYHLKDTAGNIYGSKKMAEEIVSLRHAGEPKPEGRDIQLRQDEITAVKAELERGRGKPSQPGKLAHLTGSGTKPGTEDTEMPVWFDPLLDLTAENDDEDQ